MKIFFSHSSMQKPLVRALRSHLPQHINAWIDEDNLLLGDTIEQTLEEVLSTNIDYVLLIVDQFAARSEWVAKEISWTLETEKATGRRILLPIVIEASAWEMPAFSEIHGRKYIPCEGKSISDIRSAAEKIASMLFSLICRDFEQLAQGERHKTHIEEIGHVHDKMEEFALSLRELVFPHRDYNPVEAIEINRQLTEQGKFTEVEDVEFLKMVREVLREGLIPGLVFDGKFIYVKEEHFRWKSQMASESKEEIARKAASFIKSGDTIALDSGSTTEALTKVICTLLANRSLVNLKIITNSLPAINQLLDTAVTMGLDEQNDLFELHVPSGYARPNTLSIVDMKATKLPNFANMLRAFGGADICFVGVNGIHPDYGFTTHSERSASRKKQILRHSKQKYILGDSTKFGIHEDLVFAPFQSQVTLITNECEDARQYEDAFDMSGKNSWLGRKKAKILFAGADEAEALKEDAA